MISKHKFYLMWIMAIIVLIIIDLMFYPFNLSKRIKKTDSDFIYSHVSYEELDSEIGCGSKYSKARKKDIFNSRYKNHWMVWGGEVILPDADRVSLNCDGKGIQDLVVTFANKNTGYDLMEGNHISVRFLMKHAGGCILPFSGEKATIYP